MSDSTSEVLPAEYVEQLREMSRDPAMSGFVRDALWQLNDAALLDAVFPVPADWHSDDYGLFCRDRRVRRAEYARRLAVAVDAWHERSARRWLAQLDGQTRTAIEEQTRQQFLGEIASWLRAHPGTAYDGG